MSGDTDDPVVENVREHEDDLRDLAETDLPAAKWARRLLALAEADGGES